MATVLQESRGIGPNASIRIIENIIETLIVGGSSKNNNMKL
jgi:hypothetical protein